MIHNALSPLFVAALAPPQVVHVGKAVCTEPGCFQHLAGKDSRSKWQIGYAVADVTKLVVVDADVMGMSPSFAMGEGAAEPVVGQAEAYCKQWQLGMAGRGRGRQWPPKLLGGNDPTPVADACELGRQRARTLDDLVVAVERGKESRIAAVQQALAMTYAGGSGFEAFTGFDQVLGKDKWLGKAELLGALRKNCGGDAYVLQLRGDSVDAYAQLGDTSGGLDCKPLGRGEGQVWPDPRKSVVVVSNGTDHFNGVCHGGREEPEDEWRMAVPKNAQLDKWLNGWGVDLWPSTGNGFCGYESLSVSAALAGRNLCE